MKSTNPLRYPGGKYYLAEYISRVLQANDLIGCTLHEPYAGSAAVSLEMLFQGQANDVVIVEKDPLIFSFWQCVVYHTDELCEAIDNLDITLETWYKLAPLRKAPTPLTYPRLQLGLAGLFFNRTNYSGIINANPLGGKEQKSDYKIDCRFNKEIIKNHIIKIAERRANIVVKWANALNYLNNNYCNLNESHCFIYIDPPYYEQGKNIYRYFYTDDEHKHLATFLLRSRFPWLISYDDNPFIRKLYLEQDNIYFQRLYCDYSAQKHKRGKEILISNLHIPPLTNLATTEAIPCHQ